jgi:hypothetical protein
MMRAGNAMRRHDFDPIAFVFGLAFTGLGLLFLVGRFDLFNHARWLWPGLLVVLGLAVLVGARGRGAHGGDASRRGAVSAPVDAGPPPDLDSIEPPVGPDAFRLPGWPPAGHRAKAEPDAGAATEVLPSRPAEETTQERAEETTEERARETTEERARETTEEPHGEPPRDAPPASG